MPRGYVRKRETRYTLQDIYNAVKDVVEKRKTYRQAAATYNVPIKVIFDRIKGRKINIEQMGAGVKRVLPEKVEQYIVSCIKTRAQMGQPCKKEELKLLVKEYVESNALKTTFIDNKPGDYWYLSFMKRHPELSLKKPEHLRKVKVNARKPYIVYDFYDTLKCVMNENNLQDKPDFIYNCDESGFQSDPNRVRGIGEKEKPLSRVSGVSGRESTTVLACVSAKGLVLPPLIVYKGAAVQACWTSEKSYPGTLYAVSKNGWMEESIFFYWLTKSFIPHIKKLREGQNEPNQKALLIYDGHCSHITLRIIEEAEKANIILVKFPSHLTDGIQPLDECVFDPFKKTWDKKLVENGIKQMGVGSGRLSRAQFSELLGEVYYLSLKSEIIVSGFTTTGLYPVDPSKFPEHLFKQHELKVYTNIINGNNIQQRHHKYHNETEHIALTQQIEGEIEEHYLITIWEENNRNEIQQGVTNTLAENKRIVIPQEVTNTLEENNRNEINDNQTDEEHATTEYIIQQTDKTCGTVYSLNNSDKVLEGNQNEKTIQCTQIFIVQTQSNNTSQLSDDILPGTSKSRDIMMLEDNNTSPLINKILKLISLDTEPADHVKGEISRAHTNSVVSDEIKSLSKEQIENSFGIKSGKKTITPRLKQCAYGEVLTTSEVKERLKKTEDEKQRKKTGNKQTKKTFVKEKGKTRKEFPVETGEPKTKKQRLKRNTTENTSSDDNVSDAVVEYNESDSDYDVENEFENIVEYDEPNKSNDPECGNFVLVAFKGGKRMTTIYKYLCRVDKIDEEEMEIQVTSLKCMDSSKMLFSLNDNDKSGVPYEDVMGIISEPRIILRGERILYKFERPVDVFERA